MNELDHYKNKLDEKNQEFEDFVYIISHDIKAPLRAISNLSDWIEEDLGDNIDQDILTNMSLLKNRVQRMEMMMNALTQISRIKRYDLKITHIDVHKVALEIWQDMDAPDTLELKTEGEWPVFSTYGHKLKLVLNHLIENAVKFSGNKKGIITLTCTECDDYYKFEVQDMGVGIKENLKEKVFSIFFTVESKEELNSIGAGLTICKKIVEFAGGDIQLDSEEGKGTKVTFTWPRKVE